MRPFDAHVHVGHWQLVEFAGHASTLLDAHRIYLRWNWAGALLFPTDAGDSLALLSAVGQLRAGLEYRVAWWADPRKAGDLQRLDEHRETFAALKIHPSLVRIPASDPVWDPYLEIARVAELPVVIHCGRWQEMAGFAHALELSRRHPDVPVILAHMGGDSPHLVRQAIQHLASGSFPDVRLGTESIREPWLLEQAIAALGAQRLIFGSDYNLNHPEVFRRLIEVLDISDGQREQIFRHNVNAVLPTRHRI